MGERQSRRADVPLTDEQRRLVEENQGLVAFTIRRYFPGVKPHEFEDAFAAGLIGLCRGVQRWDASKGKLSTIAVQWIRAAIQRDRADFEGINYRSAVYAGAVESYQAPKSINELLSRKARKGWDALLEVQVPDPQVDVEAEVVDPVVPDVELVARMREVCSSPLERMVIDVYLEFPHLSRRERDAIVAERSGRAFKSVGMVRRDLGRAVKREVCAA